MELGIITKTTKARLSELETKLAELNEKITVENAKYKIPITKEDVIEFITTSLKKDAGFLINVLIKNIILYDDKIEIYYNYTNKTDTLDSIQECPFYSEKIEKEIKNTKINGENYTLIFDIEGYM